MLYSPIEPVAYSVKATLAELFFPKNYVPGPQDCTRSLAVEEHLYVGIALLFWWLHRRNNQEPFVAVASALLVSRIATYRWTRFDFSWHLPTANLAFERFPRHLPTPFPLVLVVYLPGSVAVGIAMAKAVELPVLRLRDRYFPSRSGL